MVAPPRVKDLGAIRSAEATKKRLFIFCDGTWQDGVNSNHAPTNVATLARCLKSVADDGYLQMPYYDSGVGNGTSRPAQLIDGVTGRGISAKIRNAYSFLSHNYNFAKKHDEIFLVGYSRGAFAVQCLASFINDTGLLRSRHLYYLRGLFSLWAEQEFASSGVPAQGPVKAELQKNVADLGELLHKVTITACVVYDTVSALGLPAQLSPRQLSFVGRTVPRTVKYAFQALALDERRAKFKPLVWEPAPDSPTVLKQCWFLGGHGDVGGNGDAALGAVTLIWMIGQLRTETGATFDDGEVLKHLKHRLLEWEVRVNRVLGMLKEKSTLSTITHSGQVKEAKWYWWLLGLKSRKVYLETALRAATPIPIHFTVRLATAAGRNSCRSLKNWKTKHTSDGGVYWCLPGSEEEVEGQVREDTPNVEESWLLEQWPGSAATPSVADFPEFRAETDRTRFARLRGLITDKTDMEGAGGKLASFADFLHAEMNLVNGQLAPQRMYSRD